EAAHVGGGIKTTNGDIEIGTGSRVEGGIVVEKPHGQNWFGKHKPPTIIIGPDVIVTGDLRFDQPVHLYVSSRAHIGNVTGATPVSFTGDRPDASAGDQVEK